MSRRFHEDFPITALLLMIIGGFFVLELVAIHKLSDDGINGLVGILIFGGGGLIDRGDGPLFLLGVLDHVAVVRDHEIWRAISSTALHYGLIHLLFNASALLSLGRLCEPLISSPKFFTFFVLCGLGGSVARIGLSELNGTTHIVSAGASGAVMGLVGVLLTYSLKERIYELRKMIVSVLIQMAFLSVIAHAVLDHAAHAGGFVTGCLLGFAVPRYTTSDVAERWRMPSHIAGAVYAAGLLSALYKYFSFLWENA